MGWTLQRGEELIARLELRRTDMPWFICAFRREPGFRDFEAMFAEQEELLEAGDWDRVEALWTRLHARLRLVDDDPSQPPIHEYLLRVDGDEAWLRF